MKTKIVSILLVITAVAQLGTDVLDGNGVAWAKHLDQIQIALGGVGLFFLRDAVAKVQNALK